MVITIKKVLAGSREVSKLFEEAASKSPPEMRRILETYQKYIGGVANLSKLAAKIKNDEGIVGEEQEQEYAAYCDRFMRSMPTLPPEVKKAFDFLVIEANAQMKRHQPSGPYKAYNAALKNFVELCAAEVTRAAKTIESRFGNADPKIKAKVIGELNKLVSGFDKLGTSKVDTEDEAAALGFGMVVGGIVGALIGLVINLATHAPAGQFPPSPNDYI